MASKHSYIYSQQGIFFILLGDKHAKYFPLWQREILPFFFQGCLQTTILENIVQNKKAISGPPAKFIET